ncbi:hypothetical protein EW145_g5552 [Phellinidium pouzarii]|uniref:Nuclear condensin complex subunit 3 C-terminal domain-containing protein n=1 Tax=Phellinidium pouzarii TaxID=167371 RepID=A0A4S4L0W6_9AGAM|nr:hypothetical protein EW145_g5552 [Phellinidium pouzarii]
MPLQRTATPVLIAIPENMPKIFEQAQTSTANHQKNFVALNKLHHAAASVTSPTQDGIEIQLTGEKLFEDLFIDMLLRVLPLKKGATVVDRVVKFVADFAQLWYTEKKATEDENDEDTTTTRFISRLVKCLLKGFEAKDKTVRFRVLQIVAEMLSTMGDIDDDVYELLHASLVDRAHDKEQAVRHQAVIALSKLLSPENSTEAQDELMDVLLDILVHDPAAEVRKAALLHIPLVPHSLPGILSRARDVDASVRRLVYTPVLEQLEHPKQLTIVQRNFIVRTGLKDREQVVRSAAAKLVSSWADLLSGDILQFISLFDFDLVETEDHPAAQAIFSIFETRADILDNLEFGDNFWQSLTREKAFLARVFVDYCIQSKDEARIETNMPVMTALAFKIQALYNDLLNRVQTDEEIKVFGGDMAESSKNEDALEMQFILAELMKLAINMDYADEIGRRKMFALVRNMISQDSLPEKLMPLCLDILRKLTSGERDLIRIVVEVIHELRDNDSDEDDMRGRSADTGTSVDDTPMPPRTPGHARKLLSEMTPEEKERADAIDLRCLSLCIGMLERVNSSFEENSTLEGILGELIIPAVKRKELPLREKGLVSLGLCCLIARRMALNSFQLFLQQVQQSPEMLKLRILHIVFDIMMVHEGDFLGNAGVGGDRVVDFLTKLFELEVSSKVQAVICTGLAKLMLSGMISDEKVLKSLIVAYMSPETADNQEVRQCLSYFFPVYCYSSSTNQRRMQEIFMRMYEELSRMHSELDSEEEMVTPLQAGSLLIDWMDPQKTIQILGQKTDMHVHFDLGIEIMKALLNKDFEKDDRKVFCQLLTKLYIPDEVDDDKIRTLKLLINNVRSRRPIKDTTSNNALTRFDNTISKKFEAQLEEFNEEEYRQLENLKDLFDFLDDIIPEDDEEEVKPKRGPRKRRSESIATTATETGADEDDYVGTPEPKLKTKGKGIVKKRRVSKSDDDESEDETLSAPSRTLPRRAARKAVPVVEVVHNSEEDEEIEIDYSSSGSDTEDEELISRPSKAKSRRTMVDKRRTGQRLHTDIEMEGDSIMNTTLEVDDAAGDDSKITLIPPENAGRIRKSKKKRPASRGDNSSGELNSLSDVSLRRDLIASQTHSPRPGSLIPSRAGSSSRIESRNFVASTSGFHAHSREELHIPNFPPPSFEEAIASTPSPRTPSLSSQATSRTTADRRTSPEQALSRNQASAVFVEYQYPSLPEDEDARSESSHSSLEFAHGREGHSQWEGDRKAGFSLEERVRRELERRRLAESLPHALTMRVSEEDASSFQVVGKVVDTIAPASRKPEELMLASSRNTGIDPSNHTHQENGIYEYDADNAECGPPHTDVGSTRLVAADTQASSSQQPTLVEDSSVALSREGKEKAFSVEEAINTSSLPESVTSCTFRGGTISRLRDALNAPLHLRILDENNHELGCPLSEGSAMPQASDFISPHPLSNSHRFSDSHLRLASSSNTVSSSTGLSTVICPDCLSALCICTSKSVSSQPIISALNSHYTSSSPSVSTSNQLDPDIPSDDRPPSSEPSAVSNCPAPISTRRNLLPSSASSVRDRISAYEYLTSRPVPPPPPPRPFIRRPPPPLPRSRGSSSLQPGVCDDSVQSPSSTVFCDSISPVLSVRRNVPPPSSISLRHRKDKRRNLNSLPETSAVGTKRTLSTFSEEESVLGTEGDIRNLVDESVVSELTTTQQPLGLATVNSPVAAGRTSSPPVTQPVSYPETEAISRFNDADIIEVSSVPLRIDSLSPSAEDRTDGITTTETRVDAESETVPNVSEDLSVLPISSESTPAPRDVPHQSLGQVLPESQIIEADLERLSLGPLQPMFTGPTDLDLLLARLEDPDFTFGGQSYDDILLLEEIIGPAARSQVSESSVKFEDVPLGKVEVLRRRTSAVSALASSRRGPGQAYCPANMHFMRAA